MTRDSKVASGIAFSIGAYLTWGLFPLYWKQLAGLSPLVIVAHRVIWSFAFVALLLTLSGRWTEFMGALRDRRLFSRLLLSTALISCNWLLFIWAVNSGHITQGSLGYYINPLLNVLLATAVLGERLRSLQTVAIVLAAVGVLFLTVALGEFPWVALTLASSFAVYGLVRKVAPVGPLAGLGVETLLALPFALAYLGWAKIGGGTPLMGNSIAEALLLVGAGVFTALPLLWFAAGAKRLRYATMGVIQYIAPTCQLGVAVLVYGEPFTREHTITFTLIWLAVVLYAIDGFRAASQQARPDLAAGEAASAP